MAISPKAVSNKKDNAYLAYGKALAAWASVERACYAWFEHLTLLGEQQARGIFYSARSFDGRMGMLKAALEHSGIMEAEITDFAKEAFKKASTFSKFRNTLAHGEFTYEGLLIEGKHPPKKAKELAIDGEKLRIATQNFQNLANLIHEVLYFVDEIKTPESSPRKCLQLILELPDQADSNQPPQKAVKLARRQSAFRRSK
jgi:hypothetical protein